MRPFFCWHIPSLDLKKMYSLFYQFFLLKVYEMLRFFIKKELNMPKLCLCETINPGIN
jgi:hypothetical protein